jgi:ABC-2 type transport system permease protein
MSELVFSIVLLFATALGITYLAGKIYRTGILMYGRKFSFAEILRWMQRKE